MCLNCQPAATTDRRRFLARLGALGAVAGGALLLGDDLAQAAAPPFETAAMGEDRRLSARVLADGRNAKPPPGSSGSTQKEANATRLITPVGPPHIVTRAEWGADESRRTSQRAFAPVRKLVVHHTASPSNPRDPAALMREIQRFDVRDRGWNDFGYNFAIDQDGVVYEGRWARAYQPGEVHDGEDPDGLGIVGAHAAGANAGSCGIVLLGDFTSSRPTKKAIASLVRVLAWKASVHRIDAARSDLYVGLFGQRRTFPNVTPHRGVGVTLCPGSGVVAQLGAIRGAVREQAGAWPALTVDLASTIRYRGGMAPITPTTPTTPTRPSTSTPGAPQPATAAPPNVPVPVAAGAVVGYRVLTADGRVTTIGKAPAVGQPKDQGASGVAAIAPAGGARYYTLDRTGRVLAFGGARHYGDLQGTSAGTAADLAVTPRVDGYWVLTADGSVYGFGSARHFGSPKRSGLGGRALHLRPTPSGRGYWVLTDEPRVLAYGDAPALGLPAKARYVDLAPTASGRGYWVVDASGAVRGVGDAIVRGDLTTVAKRWAKPAIGIVASPRGRGYAVLAADGGLFTFGDAPFLGSLDGSGRKAVGVAAVFG